MAPSTSAPRAKAPAKRSSSGPIWTKKTPLAAIVAAALIVVVLLIVSQQTGASKAASDAAEGSDASSGVVVDVIKQGDGKTYPKRGQRVTVHYTGTLTNGRKFDSSRDRGQPFSFVIGVGQVIKGWDVGVAKMSVGERAKLTISPDYGYGSRGAGGVIPGGATLIFDVELISVQ